MVQTYVNPTEDPNKVTTAVRNMFPKSDFILKNTEVYFSTEELENLKKIKD